MEWTRSETIGLAKPYCTLCEGQGILFDSGGEAEPCPCVLRAIFRACYARFRRCLLDERSITKVSLVQSGGRDRKRSYERLVEDYIADFCLVSKRTLSAFEHQVFRYHFLLGADWRLCCQRLKVNRGVFFHYIYRIQQKLGRVFRELQPYSLFPLDEYFAGRIETTNRHVVYLPDLGEWPDEDPDLYGPLRPPLREAA